MTCSTRIWTNFATREPIRYLRMAKHGPLVAILAHILVEQVISFKMSGQTSKSDKY